MNQQDAEQTQIFETKTTASCRIKLSLFGAKYLNNCRITEDFLVFTVILCHAITINHFVVKSDLTMMLAMSHMHDSSNAFHECAQRVHGGKCALNESSYCMSADDW